MFDKFERDGTPIGSLLRLAAPRDMVPTERALRVKAAVRGGWRQATHGRLRRIGIVWLLGGLAVASLVLLSVHVALRQDPGGPGVRGEPPLAIVATVEALSGSVQLVPASTTDMAVSFQVGDSIRVGSHLETTSGGRAALRLPSGVSVRVDSATRVRFTSERSLFLERGGVYVDSEGRGGADALEIQTAMGLARDIGTRFEVRVSDAVLRVRVRDGMVQLIHGGQADNAKRGRELTVDRRGNVVRRTVAVDGSDWSWADALARTFELEGQSLSEFLTWVSREKGWQLRFADAVVQREATKAILHGSIEGLTLEEAVPAVLSTAGFDHQLKDGVLMVRLSSGERIN